MSIADVKPTRMELIETKRKIKLSKGGYKLLKMKRDGLIMEFFELLPKVKDLRNQLSEYSLGMNKELNKISFNDISIKATTNEKLGFIGQEKGIACHAVALIKKI